MLQLKFNSIQANDLLGYMVDDSTTTRPIK